MTLRIERSFGQSGIPLIGLIAGVVFALIWSGSFIATKIALPLTSPLWLAAGRLVAAALVLLPFVGPQALADFRTASPARRWRLFAAAVLIQSYYLGAVFSALTALPAALVAVVGSSLPLISIPIATALLGERASSRALLSTLGAVVSIGLVILGRDRSIEVDSLVLSPAVLLMLSAVLALAIGNTILKPITGDKNLLSLIAMQMVLGSGVSVILAAALEGWPTLHWTSASVAAFFYLVVVGSVVGMCLWVVVLRSFSAITASGFFLLTPVLGTVLGFLILGERLTALQLIGTGLLCLMILIRSSPDIRDRP